MSSLSDLGALEALLKREIDLASQPDRIDVWTLLWSDYKHRLAQTSAELHQHRREYISALSTTLMTRLTAEKLISVFELAELQARLSLRKRYDVLIVTPLEVERNAARVAIDAYLDLTPTEFLFRGIPILEWQLRLRDGLQYRLGLCKVGKARNVRMAVFCDRLFAGLDVGMCMLVGMAGGLPSEVKLGDVVAASTVLDYEGGSVVLGADGKEEHLPEILEENVKFPLDNWLEGLDPNLHNLEAIRNRAIDILRRAKWTIPPGAEKDFKYNLGVVATGEKVRRDSMKVAELSKEVDRKVYAVEMEAFGFAHACEAARVPWAVFRGIADYQDMSKTKEWQPIASLNAALTAMVWLVERVNYSALPR